MTSKFAPAIGLLLLSTLALGADETVPASSTPRYTFSWPLGSSDALKPRGGTTRGAPVVLDEAPGEAWRALQAPGLSSFERDRRAILAMAGEFQVTFDFLEVATYLPGAPRDRPYQSWGTERVYVERNAGRFISLLHILEMHVVQDDGSIGEPMVTKHWRQDWQFEPAELVAYEGRNRWERRPLSRSEREGQWSQSVYQVDESPRYASTGHWEHTSSFSAWRSGQTWRPLPRREWSVRKDYQALIGTNRHTVTATGWLQEEDNLKAVLTEDRKPDPARPYLAREYGVARYARLRNADFAAAGQYYERTRAFWDAVRAAWSSAFQSHSQITLKAPVDQAGLFMPLFTYADQLAEGTVPERSSADVIRTSLEAMGAPL